MKLGLAACFGSLLFVFACGGAASSPAGAAQQPADASSVDPLTDAGADAGDDAQAEAAAPDAAPVPRPDSRRIVKYPGPVLPHPVVVPLFYGDDADRAKSEALLAALPGSDYWKLLAEYGVGDVTVTPSVTIAAKAPATFSLDDVEDTIASLIASGAVPKPDGSQIYAINFPTQTDVTTSGASFCATGGAYHMNTSGRQPDFSYSVTPRCKIAFDEFTISLTHELIEAATDPLPLTTPAWAFTDPGHVGFRGEVGDLCDYGGATGAGISMFGTRVERVFSNARAAAGGDPCLPSLGLPYFDAAPVPTDDVTVNDIVVGPVKGRAVKLAKGEKKDVSVVLYADRSVPAWTLKVQALSISTMQPSTSITASLDRTSGSAGDVATMTVERVAPADQYGDVVFIYSIAKTAYWSDQIYVGE